MYFEQDQIDEILICQQCKQKLDEPLVLGCGAIVCLSCSYKYNKTYDCLICFTKHNVPSEGLPRCEPLVNLLSLQANEIFQGNDINELKQLLFEIEKKTSQIEFNLSNGVEKIKEHCIDLRSDVQLATELSIQKLNNFNDEFINRIDIYEQECIKAFKMNKEMNEKFINVVQELKSFNKKCKQFFKKNNSKIDGILDVKNVAQQCNKKADDNLNKLNELIFNNNILKFEKNILADFQLGSFFNDIPNMDSAILTQKQMAELMILCEFDKDQKWKSLYRASVDQFTAKNFHLKCDGNKDTLIVIKSTSGNIFGGYTKVDWSQVQSPGHKSDADAFLFSLVNEYKTPLLMKCCHSDNAVWCDNQCGPEFGIYSYIFIYVILFNFNIFIF
jgi:hypothetical protein